MEIKVDFNKVIGKIKPMHGVGQAPMLNTDFSMFHYLKEANIPFSRLHDVGGLYGEFRWVDIPNIFRDFSADPYNENSYDFAFTDLLITALVENGVQPFYRLGVTIENDCKIKAYRIYPPADFKKWAVICEHIIRHYNEGWANGFHYNIQYWEIWNEPDDFENMFENMMWRGTKEEYFDLYTVTSKHLKSRFPHLKIGGYGSCGFYALSNQFVETANSSQSLTYFLRFFEEFLEHVKKEGCPLDFFSWHSYSEVDDNAHYARYARERLDAHGFTRTETTCNEWHPYVSKYYRGSYFHAAKFAGMMLNWQNTPLDSAMFYDARCTGNVYGGLFNPLTEEPFPAYYAFKAYGKLYGLGQQVLVEGLEQGVYAVGATDEKEGCLMIANTTEQEVALSIVANRKIREIIITGDDKTEESITNLDVIPKYSVVSILFDCND